MSPAIEDYALIGDLQTAALVAKSGSIDWWCCPRFDSNACFAALLGDENHGRWRLSPRYPAASVKRSYRGNTLVLETEFTTDSGVATVIDFMPERRDHPTIIRIVEGRRGSVHMHSELVVRFDYGSVIPWVKHEDGGVSAIAGPDALRLHSPITNHGEDYKTIADFTVHEGERVPFVLVWHPSHLAPPDPLDAVETLRRTTSEWHTWAARCRGGGEYADAVTRSLITLRALTFAPTGGIVAAATTSLPEQLGGGRNWDYRYTWIRDATFTLSALLSAGYPEEAIAWRDWLLRAIAGSPDKFQIMYGVAGERRLTEVELDWLPGYEQSAPVRIGNAASNQFQLDVFGEVMDAMYQARSAGMPPTPQGWRMTQLLMEHLEGLWKEPDDGIWEIRGQRRHFVHSKVMAWVAFDRAIKSIGNESLSSDGNLSKWEASRERLRQEILEKGFDTELNSFVQYFGSKEVDAALLMIPLVGFLPGTDPRVIGTIDRIQQELSHDGFVQRYRTAAGVDGLSGTEGSFFMCSFWLADALILAGRKEEGRLLFEKLLALRNDVGLLSEEYDVQRKRLIGNFPQAFSHISLVNTAANLVEPDASPARARGQEAVS
ncbi:MAG: Trehalase [Acidimicrobiales bacterium]|nr:MAG: glycoside hydrolase family 15 protein [Actinomycetota bacterium]MBV6509061.1 Trehalase [Acidimicrobiales bacterium]RIK06231.1 MAG: glucoamylase [Acidobacteriota bacterium]